MTADDQRFFAYEVSDCTDMRIEVAPLQREWMDGTDKRAAYRCLPMVIANQAGWVIPCPVGFTAVWDGGMWQKNVSLIFDQPGVSAPDPFGFSVVAFSTASAPPRQENRIISHFGNGVITFTIPYLFRTPRGINLWVKGPSNWFKDGIHPLEGIVETDWLPSTFTMNWKLTRPHHPVRFERGDPICMVVPVRRGLAESLQPCYAGVSQNPELEADYQAWMKSRASFNEALRGQQPDVVRRGWQRDYVKGLTPSGQHAEEHQTGLSLKPFTQAQQAPANREEAEQG
jgi:hypothetical protein